MLIHNDILKVTNDYYYKFNRLPKDKLGAYKVILLSWNP